MQVKARMLATMSVLHSPKAVSFSQKASTRQRYFVAQSNRYRDPQWGCCSWVVPINRLYGTPWYTILKSPSVRTKWHVFACQPCMSGCSGDSSEYASQRDTGFLPLSSLPPIASLAAFQPATLNLRY